MSEIANYFKREKYITRRLSLLTLPGLFLVTPLVLASAHGRVSIIVLICVIVAWICLIGFAVIAIVRGARRKFPKPAAADNAPLDKATRRKLQRRIWTLEIFAAIYAAALMFSPLRFGKDPRLPLLTSMAMDLLIVAASIKAARRLKRKLKAATAATVPN